MRGDAGHGEGRRTSGSPCRGYVAAVWGFAVRSAHPQPREVERPEAYAERCLPKVTQQVAAPQFPKAGPSMPCNCPARTEGPELG